MRLGTLFPSRRKNSFGPLVALGLGLCLCLFVTEHQGYAQYTTASLGGTVVDNSGALIPGALVTLTNEDTGLTRSVESGADGSYLVSALPVGTYTLTVAKEGFSKYIQRGIVLAVSAAATQRVELKVGQVTQEVTVSAQPPLVNTRVAAVDQVVGEKPILDLPLNGRQAQQLVFLTAGSVDVTNRYCLVNCQGGVYPGEQEAAVNGGGPGAVNYQLDGGNYNDTYMNTNLPFPNPDAVQEFAVQSNNLSAEYGTSASAVVNIVTKSGTNSVHGDAFEFLRNGDLNARNFFAPTQDTLKRNQFGGSVGGPIKKDKLFYFGTLQATRVRMGAAGLVAFVPTQAERNGDFSAIPVQLVDPVTGVPFPRNQIPTSRFSPAAEYFLNTIPLPNGPGGEVTFAGPHEVMNDFQWMAKMDYVQSKHHLSGRYFWTRFNEPPDITDARQDILAVDGNGNKVTINNLAVNDTYTLKPSLLLNTWFGWDQQTGGSISGAPFGFPNAGIKLAAPTPPELCFTVGGFFSIATNHDGQFNRSDWTLRENATYMKGKHEVKFGGEVIRVKNHITNTFSMSGCFCFTGSLSGSNLVDFMLGRASAFAQGGGEFKNMTGTILGFYGQDTWRATTRLNLTGGLRWDPYIPYRDIDGRVVCFEPGKQSTRYPNAPLGMLFGGNNHDAGCPVAGSYNNLGNFAPRVGFAYRVTQDGRTSVRGGAGFYYIPPMSTQFNAFADVAPFAPRFVLTDISFDDPYGSAGLANPFPAQYGPTIPGASATFSLPLSIRWYFPLDFHESQLATWNLTLERQVGASWLFRAAYVGNKGTYLSNGSKNYKETNPAIYIPGASTEANTQSRRQYTNFSSIGQYSSDNNSHYNALQLTAQKRLSHGVSVLANYTWAKTLDDYGWTDPFYRSFDYGISDDNSANLVSISGIWEIPATKSSGLSARLLNGWEATTIVSWKSGFPFSILSGVDNSFSGVGRDRADFTGSNLSQANLDPGRPHGQLINEYFNTALFVPNAVGTFGNTAKNILVGPGLFDTDFGLIKNTTVWERTSLQFRAEFFNLFNNVNFMPPGNTVGTSSFGVISSANNPRIVQFALKFLF